MRRSTLNEKIYNYNNYFIVNYDLHAGFDFCGYKPNQTDHKLTQIKPAQQHIIRQPDLSVDDMKWSFPLKQGFLVGQNSIFNFTLKNQGAAPSGNFTIKFNCPNCPPSMTGIRTISSMAPGTAFSNNWPSLPAVPEEWSTGTYTLEVIIDPNGIVKDSNRTNNRKILQFAVTARDIIKSCV